MMDPEDKFLHNLRKTEQTRHQEPSHMAWEKIRHAMDSKKSKKKKVYKLYWLQVAATFLLICFLCVIYYFFINKPLQPQIAQSTLKVENVSSKDSIPDNSNPESTLHKSYEPKQETKPDVIKKTTKTNSDFTTTKEEALAYEPKVEQMKSKKASESNMDASGTKPSLTAPPQETRSRTLASPQAAVQLAYSLFPSNASGRWAGTFNSKKYTAILKNGDSGWELTGFYTSRKNDKFIIGEQVLKHIEKGKTTNYNFDGLDGKQSKYSNPKNAKDYFLISYENDKIAIYQYGKSKLPGNNNLPINSWILTKSYE